MKPENVDAALATIKRLRGKIHEQLATLAEMEAAIAVEFGANLTIPEEHDLWTKSRYTNPTRCAACGAALGGRNERVVTFKGRYWHKRNCIGKAGT